MNAVLLRLLNKRQLAFTLLGSLLEVGCVLLLELRHFLHLLVDVPLACGRLFQLIQCPPLFFAVNFNGDESVRFSNLCQVVVIIIAIKLNRV